MLDLSTKFVLTLLLAVGLVACDEAAVSVTKPVSIEHLLVGGMVFDGTGAPPTQADVGIDDGKIVFIGNAANANVSALETIDVSGQWVAPGFIDIHSHAVLDEDYGRDALPYLYQGITTVVLGVDGAGTSDVANRLQQWQETGLGANGLVYVGHGHIRNAVMGAENRAPTEGELEAMHALVRKGMDEGAFGLSTGLFYVPGTYATTEEVIALAKTAAAYEGAIYDTHDRDLGAVYQGIGYDASVAEGIRIVEESGLRGIFSHYNLQGAHNYGRGDDGARFINEARERGVDVWAGHHPYTATQSNLRSYTIPDWAVSGGHERMVERFDDPEERPQIVAATEAMLEIRGGADKILFVDPDPELNGNTLADMSRQMEMSPAETVQALLRSGNKGVMNLQLYDDVNTERLAQEAWMMTCTDGRTPRPDQPITHPRTYGAFPKKMRSMVLDRQLLAPEFVIRSFSGLAADFLRLDDRGYLREGYVADIAVIDPDNYRDLATFESPRQYSEGVQHVLVNGEFAVKYGEASGAMAGLPIKRPN